MKTRISQTLLFAFLFTTALSPVAHAQSFAHGQNSYNRVRDESRFQRVSDQTAARLNAMDLQQELRFVSDALGEKQNNLNKFIPQLNPFSTLNLWARRWLAPVFALAFVMASAQVAFAKDEDVAAKTPESTTSAESMVTRDYPLGAALTANGAGAFLAELEWRSSFTEPDGFWAYKAKIARADKFYTLANEVAAPLNVFKLSLKRFWEQERKPFVGTAFNIQGPSPHPLSEVYLGLGATLWKQEYDLPLIGLTAIDHTAEMWPGYRPELQQVRFPFLDKLGVENKDLSLTTYAGFDPSTQKWIAFFQGWRHIGTFGGSVLNFGYAVGYNSTDHHLIMTLPTDSERFSLILHQSEWDVQFDYLPKTNEYGVTFDLLRAKPAPQPKSDEKGNQKPKGDSKSSSLPKSGDIPSATPALFVRSVLLGSFLPGLRRVFQLLAKTFLQKESHLNLVFIDQIKNADKIAKSVMDFYDRNQKVIFVVRDVATLAKIAPFLSGKNTYPMVADKAFNAASLHLSAVERQLPEILPDAQKSLWIPYVVKASHLNPDFSGLDSSSILSEKNIIFQDLTKLISIVDKLKIGHFNLLQWNPVRDLMIVLTSA